jgi:hypothetical protein
MPTPSRRGRGALPLLQGHRPTTNWCHRSNFRLHYVRSPPHIAKRHKTIQEWSPAAAVGHGGKPGGAHQLRQGEDAQGRSPKKVDRVAARVAHADNAEASVLNLRFLSHKYYPASLYALKLKPLLSIASTYACMLLTIHRVFIRLQFPQLHIYSFQ